MFGSISRCCNSRASSHLPEWHSCSSWQRGVPSALPSAQIPPTAPGAKESTQPIKKYICTLLMLHYQYNILSHSFSSAPVEWIKYCCSSPTSSSVWELFSSRNRIGIKSENILSSSILYPILHPILYPNISIPLLQNSPYYKIVPTFTYRQYSWPAENQLNLPALGSLLAESCGQIVQCGWSGERWDVRMAWNITGHHC